MRPNEVLKEFAALFLPQTSRTARTGFERRDNEAGLRDIGARLDNRPGVICVNQRAIIETGMPVIRDALTNIPV
jgi:hypothetical protein